MPQQPSDHPSGPKKAELDEAADRLMELAADETLIAGIYNYCDRWCERCSQTGRCLNFKLEQERARQPNRDLLNREFWNELSASFALTEHLIRREAKKQGIDLSDPVLMKEVEEDRRRRRQRADQEATVLRALTASYTKQARTMLEGLNSDLRAAETELAAEARLGTGDPQAVAAGINDAIEVVQRYLFFIEVKLHRAVSSRVGEKMEGVEGGPSDADGSAKVALVAIDRSIGAWARLHQRLKGAADAILDLLVQLEKLRRIVETEFPRARAFKRPGLD